MRTRGRPRLKIILVLLLLALALSGLAGGLAYAAQLRRTAALLNAPGNPARTLARVIFDSEQRRQIQARALELMLDEEARCAAVQSLTYYAAIDRDLISLGRADIWISTTSLDAYLRGSGWREVAGLDALQPGMVCFSQDRRGAPGAPDHVYTFARWLDQRRDLALVWDNKSARLHPRNMCGVTWYWFTRYHNTPFAYALTPPG